MRKSIWWTACLALTIIMAPVMLLVSPWAEQRALGLAVQDDELVLLEGNGRIKVVDPNVPSGYEEVDWQSDDTGWTDVTLGDFNGDGDQEILARKGGLAKLFDPVVQPGQVAVAGQWSISSPHKYYDMATGDIDGDGRDEIVLLREDDAANNVKSHILVYDGNTTGTGWTLRKDMEHGTKWLDVELGDVNGDGYDDLALMRNGETGFKDRLILIQNPANNYSTLHEHGYTFDWLLLELINTHKVSTGDRVEIVTSRRDVLGELPSVLAFRWAGGTSLEDVWEGNFFPYFTDIEGADLNGDGDEELVMYRNRTDTDITLISRNIAGAAMRTFEPAGANSPYGGWLAMETGDLEGDGRDEVILVRSTKYRVYDRPEASDTFYEKSGSFKGPFAVGNLDGAGIAAGPTLGANPGTLSFSFEGVIPPAQAVFISNVGEGDEFGWTATVTEGADWLSVTPTSGTTPATLSVSVDPTTLSSGTYSGQIRVDADAGIGASPQYINVTLAVVVTLPRLGVTPAELAFEMDQGQTNPPLQSVTVQNLGGGTSLSWTATPDVAWLEITPTAGNTPTTAWVEVHGEELYPGTHIGNIVFDAGDVIGSPFTLPVTLIVRPPVMQVSPATLELVASCSSAIQSRRVAISQQGGGSDIEWMAIAVEPSAGGLAGLLDTAAGEAPEVTAQGIALGGELLPPVDWITLAPESGDTPDIIHVQVDPSGLSVGQHVATIVIIGWPEYVANRIQGVDVNLFVADSCVYAPLLMK